MILLSDKTSQPIPIPDWNTFVIYPSRNIMSPLFHSIMLPTVRSLSLCLSFLALLSVNVLQAGDDADWASPRPALDQAQERSPLRPLHRLPRTDSAPGSGFLQFAEETIRIPANPGDEELTATFQFTNTGEDPITLVDISTSCGCTTAKPEKRTFEPGEAGSFEAVFHVGSRVGKQRPAIMVQTTDPSRPLYRLFLELDIPQTVEVKPRLLIWNLDEEPTSRTIDVHLHPEIEGTVSNVRFLRQGMPFSFEVEEATPQEHYRIKVTPDDIKVAPSRSTILVETTLPGQKPRNYTITVLVRRTSR